MMDNNFIRICPQCKSKEVTHRGMISREAYSNNWVCLTCGFQGPLFPEINKKEADKLPEQKRNFITTGLPIFADNLRDKKDKSDRGKRNVIVIGKKNLIVLIGLILFLSLLIVFLSTWLK